LSAIYNVPHGAGLAVVLPAWLKWFYENTKSPQAERFAKKIFSQSSAEDGINAFKKWLQKIGAPVTLKELGIDKKDIEKIVENIIKVAPKWGLENVYRPKVIKKILNLA
jgi:alcohol dehydrogenase YqhD (iron-dependent ADH family)